MCSYPTRSGSCGATPLRGRRWRFCCGWSIEGRDPELTICPVREVTRALIPVRIRGGRCSRRRAEAIAAPLAMTQKRNAQTRRPHRKRTLKRLPGMGIRLWNRRTGTWPRSWRRRISVRELKPAGRLVSRRFGAFMLGMLPGVVPASSWRRSGRNALIYADNVLRRMKPPWGHGTFTVAVATRSPKVA